MDFSVIVCTYNRAGNLPRCLGAAGPAAGASSRASWEVLVVDNNSPRRHRARGRRATRRELPITVRYALEPAAGPQLRAQHWRARVASAPTSAFVDDDIVVVRRLAAPLCRKAFERNDADAVGGRIHLDPSVKLPKWIRDERDMQGLPGLPGLRRRALPHGRPTRYPFGGNMAFNRRVVERIGYFNPKLGRKGEGRKRSRTVQGRRDRLLPSPGRQPATPASVRARRRRLPPGACRSNCARSTSAPSTSTPDTSARPTTTPIFHAQLLGVPRFYYPQLLRGAGKYLAQVVVVRPRLRLPPADEPGPHGRHHARLPAPQPAAPGRRSKA